MLPYIELGNYVEAWKVSILLIDPLFDLT